MRKPVAVTGPLLMDQRFWGGVCHQKGVGPPPTHIDDFRSRCVRFVDGAFATDSLWVEAAARLDFGDEADDGVEPNVGCFARLMEEGIEPVHTSAPLQQSTLTKQRSRSSAGVSSIVSSGPKAAKVQGTASAKAAAHRIQLPTVTQQQPVVIANVSSRSSSPPSDETQRDDERVITQQQPAE